MDFSQGNSRKKRRTAVASLSELLTPNPKVRSEDDSFSQNSQNSQFFEKQTVLPATSTGSQGSIRTVATADSQQLKIRTPSSSQQQDLGSLVQKQWLVTRLDSLETHLTTLAEYIKRNSVELSTLKETINSSEQNASLQIKNLEDHCSILSNKGQVHVHEGLQSIEDVLCTVIDHKMSALGSMLCNFISEKLAVVKEEWNQLLEQLLKVVEEVQQLRREVLVERLQPTAQILTLKPNINKDEIKQHLQSMLDSISSQQIPMLDTLDEFFTEELCSDADSLSSSRKRKREPFSFDDEDTDIE